MALLQVGFFTGIDPKLITGWQLSMALGRAHPYDNYRYHYNNVLLTGFAKYIINDSVWLLAGLDAGRTGADSIRRSIQLGKAIRVESGRTHGLVLGGFVSVGRDFIDPSGLTPITIIPLIPSRRRIVVAPACVMNAVTIMKAKLNGL